MEARFKACTWNAVPLGLKLLPGFPASGAVEDRLLDLVLPGVNCSNLSAHMKEFLLTHDVTNQQSNKVNKIEFIL